jgi:hypothetical protein
MLGVFRGKLGEARLARLIESVSGATRGMFLLATHLRGPRTGSPEREPFFFRIKDTLLVDTPPNPHRRQPTTMHHQQNPTTSKESQEHNHREMEQCISTDVRFLSSARAAVGIVPCQPCLNSRRSNSPDAAGRAKAVGCSPCQRRQERSWSQCSALPVKRCPVWNA